MKIFLSSACTGTPCAQIETNLLGTKYEVVLDHTVQPFVQHQATHSHTPLLTFDKLLSMHSMQSIRSVSGEFDVPVVDLPSTTNANVGNSSSHSAGTGTTLAACVAVPSHLGFPTHPYAPDGTQSDLLLSTSSPAASSSFLSRFRAAKQGRSEQPLPSPFASLADRPGPVHTPGTSLLSSGPPAASPSFPSSFPSSFQSSQRSSTDSFVARCQSPDAHPLSPLWPHTGPSSFPARAQSARAGSSSPSQGSCDDPTCSCQMVPRAVGGVQYKTRIRGFMRPRRCSSALYIACYLCSILASATIPGILCHVHSSC